jgi:hypothetical protein
MIKDKLLIFAYETGGLKKAIHLMNCQSYSNNDFIVNLIRHKHLSFCVTTACQLFYLKQEVTHFGFASFT